MAQSNDADFISYYNPKGPMFSDDGKILRGAYGKRIFDFDGVNQYHQCIKELKTDPDSRRAIIHIHMAQHDWTGSIDTPCTSDFQLLIRDNKLHMLNHMRSQSSAMVMPYDVFLMTMIQEFMARELDVELGEFHHYSGSLHYYLEEENFVDSILTEIRPAGSIKKPMERMPKTSIMELRKLLRFEKDIRENYYTMWDDKWFNELRNLNLNTYWEDIGYLLIVYAMIKDQDSRDEIADVISENIYDESLRHMAFQYIEEHVNR
jgi:thymidylate synthase